MDTQCDVLHYRSNAVVCSAVDCTHQLVSNLAGCCCQRFCCDPLTGVLSELFCRRLRVCGRDHVLTHVGKIRCVHNVETGEQQCNGTKSGYLLTIHLK